MATMSSGGRETKKSSGAMLHTRSHRKKGPATRGGAMKMTMVISRSHQARTLLSSQRFQEDGSAKSACGAGDSSRRTRHQTAPGRRPAFPGIACIFASFTPPPAVSMSSQYPHLRRRQTPFGAALPGRVQARANCIATTSASCAVRSWPSSRQINSARRRNFAGFCHLRGRLFNLTYSSGITLGRGFTAGGCRCWPQVAEGKRWCYLLHSFGAASQRHAESPRSAPRPPATGHSPGASRCLCWT